jgi:hypothetical protein
MTDLVYVMQSYVNQNDVLYIPTITSPKNFTVRIFLVNPFESSIKNRFING